MKEYKGLTEEEMMAAMIEVATVNGYTPDEDDDEATFDDVFTPDVDSYKLEEYFTEPTESEKYIVQQVSDRGSEGDGAEMFLTIKITDKEIREEYFIEFFGRYSSWDSSCYHSSYVVEPYQEMVTFYREVK